MSFRPTEAQRELVLRARSMFQTYDTILDDRSKDPAVIFNEPVRVFQVMLHRHRGKPFHYLEASDTALRIVSNACFELLEAVEADARDEMYELLGTILGETCGLCTGLRLDFCEIARGFDSSFLDPPGDGIVGVINLVKAVGALAFAVKVHGTTVATAAFIGSALSMICGAIHWLAFANDIDASVLFQDVMQRKMTSLPPDHGGGMSGHDSD